MGHGAASPVAPHRTLSQEGMPAYTLFLASGFGFRVYCLSLRVSGLGLVGLRVLFRGFDLEFGFRVDPKP